MSKLLHHASARPGFLERPTWLSRAPDLAFSRDSEPPPVSMSRVVCSERSAGGNFRREAAASPVAAASLSHPVSPIGRASEPFFPGHPHFPPTLQVFLAGSGQRSGRR